MKFLIGLFTIFFAISASAYVAPVYRDLKPATQAMLEHQVVTAPLLGTTNYVKTTFAGPTSAAALTLSSFSNQPDVPRNLTITPTGTTTDVEACVIVVSGKNFLNQNITENFTFLADASTAVTGSKAFKSVTSILWPANCESGGFAATWIVGTGSKLGLKNCMANAGDLSWAELGGAYEATRPTCAVSASAVESNTCSLNTALDGSKSADIFFVQNFACMP